ncbi:MAG: aldo/keto reductase, partial [Planctomycetota bacterium]
PMEGSVPSFEPEVWFDLEYDAVQDISREGILRCWLEGNRLLGDYDAQLVSVHDPDEYLAAAKDSSDRDSRYRDLVDAYQSLSELKSSGEVLAVGIGSKTWHTIDDLMQHCDFDWVMLANSFTLLSHPTEVLQFLDRLGEREIGVVNSALFHGGFLLGGDFFDYRSLDSANPLDQQRIDYRSRLGDLCLEYEVTPFQACLQFGRSHPSVHSVALSTSKATRVPQQVAALDNEIEADFWTAMKQQNLISEAVTFL